MYKVKNIFISYMGEQNASGIGTPVVFVRFSGCNVRCNYCDTPEALLKKDGVTMSLPQILTNLAEIKKSTGIESVCITGGEPMLQNNLDELFRELRDKQVFVETNGTIDLSKYLNARSDSLHFIIDYKTKKSTVRAKNRIKEFSRLLRSTDYIKFVISDYENDYLEATKYLKTLETSAKIVFGVSWGNNINVLYQWLANDGLLNKVGINIQVHKYTESE